jgi:hypothetical protein
MFTDPTSDGIPVEVTEVLDPRRRRDREYRCALADAERTGDYLVASDAPEIPANYEDQPVSVFTPENDASIPSSKSCTSSFSAIAIRSSRDSSTPRPQMRLLENRLNGTAEPKTETSDETPF